MMTNRKIAALLAGALLSTVAHFGVTTPVQAADSCSATISCGINWGGGKPVGGSCTASGTCSNLSAYRELTDPSDPDAPTGPVLWNGAILNALSEPDDPRPVGTNGPHTPPLPYITNDLIAIIEGDEWPFLPRHATKPFAAAASLGDCAVAAAPGGGSDLPWPLGPVSPGQI